MSQPMWNWQTKVNRMRKILEQNAMECTFDVGPSSASEMPTNRKMNTRNISFVSQWSTPTNVSETLVKYINYSDFGDGTGDMCRVSDESSEKDVINHEIEPLGRRTVNSLCDVPDPEQIPIESSTRFTSECHNDINLHPSLELVNCIPVLEMAKSNIVALIDGHIALFRDKSQSIRDERIKQDERNKQLKLTEVRKTIERRNHIQQIREEITNQMNHFNKLLTELERI